MRKSIFVLSLLLTGMVLTGCVSGPPEPQGEGDVFSGGQNTERADPKEPWSIDVIYLGNSGITYQQMHRTVEQITRREGFAGPLLTAHPLCRGGSTFGYHLGNLPAVRKKVEAEGCTAAVICGTMTFLTENVENLVSALKDMGLEVYLLVQPVVQDGSRERQRYFDEKHRALARETGITLIPQGTAVWDILSEVDPGYHFFAHDRGHASKKSAYLGACMIVNLITGERVVPPPEDYDFTYSGMTAQEERFLREAAEKYALPAKGATQG